MRRGKSLTVDVKFDGLNEIVGKLDQAPDAIARVTANALNDVVKSQLDRVRKETVSQLRLSSSYVANHIQIESEATESHLTAVITAPIRGTVLTRFEGTRLNIVDDKWDEAKYKAKFGSLKARVRPKGGKSPNLPWTPRKGDPLRGIPAGKKSDGVHVAVQRAGTGGLIKHGFLMPLRNGNGFGVFTRSRGAKKARHRYGPSLDQVAKKIWTTEGDKIADEVGRYVVDYLDKEFK